ncbi:MAG: L,D-transpeptidase [Bacillota bacterium]
MKVRILFIVAMIGLILAIPPYNTHIRGSAGKPAADAGSVIYADNSHSVYLRNNTVTVKDAVTGKTSRVSLPPPDTGLLPEGPENRRPLAEREGDNLRLSVGRTEYIVRLVPRPVVLATYPDPCWSGDKIIVDKHKNILYLYKKGSLVKVYRVATGEKPEYTPEGKFVIKNKFSLDPGVSDGRFGPRWLGIGVPGEYDLRSEKPDRRAPMGIKYGIHGTNEPESIGTYASGGCVRMTNRDIIEIYNLVEVGTQVEIIR